MKIYACKYAIYNSNPKNKVSSNNGNVNTSIEVPCRYATHMNPTHTLAKICPVIIFTAYRKPKLNVLVT